MDEEDEYEIVHETPPETTAAIATIRSLVGCGYVTAWTAYHKNNQDVVAAVDALIVKPVVSGERYIPPPPKVDTGMTPEQEERCRKGRWLQDQVNAVFSVAHSKTRTLQDELVPSASQASPPDAASPALPAAPPGSPQGGLEKMTLPTLQSETPP